MKTIIHLSDLHFGKVDKKRINPLISLVAKIKPDLIIVSGDLTQRATEKEYKEAKKFLRNLRYPVLIIPGNHDIPLFNVYQRLIAPFKKYSKFISSNLSPFHFDKEIAVVSINSVRRYTLTSGSISKRQISEAEAIFDELDPSLVKIVVCHHPFDLPHTKKTHHKHTHKVIGSSKRAMERLAEKKVDIFLSGHLHLSHVGDTSARYKIKDYSGIIVQAGTAISARGRGEPVSFNVLNIKRPYIKIDNYIGDANSPDFLLSSTSKFKHGDSGWKEIGL